MKKTEEKKLIQAKALLEQAKENAQSAYDLVEGVKCDQEERFEEKSESWQESDAGIALEESVDALTDVSGEIDGLVDSLGEQIEAIQEVLGK